jgi:hypothetical protein
MAWRSSFQQKYRTFLAHSSVFRRWVLSRGDTRGDAWWRKVVTSDQDRTVSPKAALRSCTNNTLHEGQDLVQHSQYSNLLKGRTVRSRDFLFSILTQTGSGANPASLGLFPQGKQARAWR